MEDQIKNPITYDIELSEGASLVVEANESFLSAIREHYNMSESDVIDDHVIKMFIWSTCNTALEKSINESGSE